LSQALAEVRRPIVDPGVVTIAQSFLSVNLVAVF
jgi:hypothetical protein